jgi:hypothetical protein
MKVAVRLRLSSRVATRALNQERSSTQKEQCEVLFPTFFLHCLNSFTGGLINLRITALSLSRPRARDFYCILRFEPRKPSSGSYMHLRKFCQRRLSAAMETDCKTIGVRDPRCMESEHESQTCPDRIS